MNDTQLGLWLHKRVQAQVSLAPPDHGPQTRTLLTLDQTSHPIPSRPFLLLHLPSGTSEKPDLSRDTGEHLDQSPTYPQAGSKNMNSAPESTYGQREDRQVPLGTSTEAWPPSLHICTQPLGYQPCFSLPAPWGGAPLSGSQFPTPWVLTSPFLFP